MSSLLNGTLSGQRLSALSYVDGTGKPHHFAGGVPYELNGSVAVDSASSVSHHHQGLAFTATGRLAVTLTGRPDRFGAGMTPISDTGRLVLEDSVSGHRGNGIPFTTNSSIRSTLMEPNPYGPLRDIFRNLLTFAGVNQYGELSTPWVCSGRGRMTFVFVPSEGAYRYLCDGDSADNRNFVLSDGGGNIQIAKFGLSTTLNGAPTASSVTPPKHEEINTLVVEGDMTGLVVGILGARYTAVDFFKGKMLYAHLEDLDDDTNSRKPITFSSGRTGYEGELGEELVGEIVEGYIGGTTTDASYRVSAGTATTAWLSVEAGCTYVIKRSTDSIRNQLQFSSDGGVTAELSFAPSYDDSNQSIVKVPDGMTHLRCYFRHGTTPNATASIKKLEDGIIYKNLNANGDDWQKVSATKSGFIGAELWNSVATLIQEGITHSDDVYSYDGTQTGYTQASLSVGLTEGAPYQTSYEISNYVAGSSVVYVGSGGSGTNATGNGVKSEVVLAGTGGSAYLFGDANFIADISKPSFKQLFNFAQGALRPDTRFVPQLNGVNSNLVLQTEHVCGETWSMSFPVYLDTTNTQMIAADENDNTFWFWASSSTELKVKVFVGTTSTELVFTNLIVSAAAISYIHLSGDASNITATLSGVSQTLAAPAGYTPPKVKYIGSSSDNYFLKGQFYSAQLDDKYWPLDTEGAYYLKDGDALGENLAAGADTIPTFADGYEWATLKVGIATAGVSYAYTIKVVDGPVGGGLEVRTCGSTDPITLVGESNSFIGVAEHLHLIVQPNGVAGTYTVEITFKELPADTILPNEFNADGSDQVAVSRIDGGWEGGDVVTSDAVSVWAGTEANYALQYVNGAAVLPEGIYDVVLDLTDATSGRVKVQSASATGVFKTAGSVHEFEQFIGGGTFTQTSTGADRLVGQARLELLPKYLYNYPVGNQ